MSSKRIYSLQVTLKVSQYSSNLIKNHWELTKWRIMKMQSFPVRGNKQQTHYNAIKMKVDWFWEAKIISECLVLLEYFVHRRYVVCFMYILWYTAPFLLWTPILFPKFSRHFALQVYFYYQNSLHNFWHIPSTFLYINSKYSDFFIFFSTESQNF